MNRQRLDKLQRQITTLSLDTEASRLYYQKQIPLREHDLKRCMCHDASWLIWPFQPVHCDLKMGERTVLTGLEKTMLNANDKLQVAM